VFRILFECERRAVCRILFCSILGFKSLMNEIFFLNRFNFFSTFRYEVIFYFSFCNLCFVWLLLERQIYREGGGYGPVTYEVRSFVIYLLFINTIHDFISIILKIARKGYERFNFSPA